MKINDYDARTVEVPLPGPISVSTRTTSVRSYSIVTLCGDDGTAGTSFCFGDHKLTTVIADIARELLGDPLAVWQSSCARLRANNNIALHSQLIAATSALDIALHDLEARSCGVPLYQFIGGQRKRVAVYVNGGYYRDNWTTHDLAQEVQHYVRSGYSAMKMRIARLCPERDELRIRAVSNQLGPHRALIIDANGKWQSVKDAMPLLDRIRDIPIAWVEDPFPETDVEAHRELHELTGIPVGTGEALSDVESFQGLLEARAIQVAQPDATVVGGVSVWRHIATLAHDHATSVVPHFFPDIHVHLAMVAPSLRYIECVDGTDIVNYALLMNEPLRAEDGYISPPDRPGLGIDWNREAIERYTVHA